VIKKALYIAFCAILIAIAILSFLRVLDAALEIDDLKSQVRLQREALQFLQDVANDTLASCGTTVANFESTAARINGRPVFWEGQIALVGPFKVTKKDSCVERIELVGL
jgi:hypothetical protein